MVRASSLPEQLTTFVGRESELGTVRQLLATTRLLTLTGAGGCGKTRLAMEFAARVGGEYPDGVAFVELAALAGPGLLPGVVASALGVTEEQDVPLEITLANQLRPLDLLLILDNCEHIVPACAALVSTLLRSTPSLKILATSRQALGIPGEVDWRVPSLTTPECATESAERGIEEERGGSIRNPHSSPITPEGLASYESVQLFVDRARLKRQDFTLTYANAPAVAQLCVRLDGIPLAIELAAARIKVLSVEQIVDRLDARFKLLTAGNPNLMPRHQTLRAAMDWSYDLLSQAERALLRSLSVFRGGFTLDALDAVCGGMVDEYEIIDLLSHLVDRSLVIAEEHGVTVRYRLLETIRQYNWEKLQQSNEAPVLQVRHRDWYLHLAQDSQVALLTEMQANWLQMLEEEHENLRAALVYCGDNADATERGLQLAGALAWFWYFRGYLSEGRVWLETMLARPDARDYLPAYIRALGAAGIIAYLQSDYRAARDYLQESAALGLETGDRIARAFTLAFLGRMAFSEGDPNAHAWIEESVATFRETGHKWGLALALDFLGNAIEQGQEHAETSELHKESLELFTQLGNRWGVALEMSSFGRLAIQRGDLASARLQLEEALAIQQSVGDKWIVAWLLNNLGDVAHYEGNHQAAASYYEESLALFRETGDVAGTASSLQSLGIAHQYMGKYEEARTLLKESLVLYERLIDVEAQALVLARLADTANAQGDSEEAISLSAQALKVALLSDDPAYLAAGLAVHASIASHTGRLDRAAALLGATDRLQKASTRWLPPTEQAYRCKLSEEIRALIGDAAFLADWQKGQELAAEPAEEIVSALADFNTPLDQGACAQPPARSRCHRALDELTEREGAVLRLVAEGYTDAQLAERLVISIRTVQAHLRSIYSKLGVATRSAATRYALERHLV